MLMLASILRVINPFGWELTPTRAGPIVRTAHGPKIVSQPHANTAGDDLPAILGRRKNGTPIYAIAGGAPATIPTSIAEWQEFMADGKRVGDAIRSGEIGTIIEAVTNMKAKERTDIAVATAEQMKALMEGEDAWKETMKEHMKSTFTDLLKDSGVNRPNLSTLTVPSPGTGAKMNAAYNPLAFGTKMDSAGFASIGDFAKNVWHKNNNVDPTKKAKMQEVMNAFSSIEPSAGGALIPETMRSEIMQLSLETAIIRPRATVITLTNLTQLVPYVDSTTNVGSVFGGMIFYWTPESGDITLTNAKFGRTKLEANKLTGGAAVPNELWSDAPALSSWLMQAVPQGISFYEDLAFLTGPGGGQPLGVLNSDALVVVQPKTGQGTGTIITGNILEMFSRMLPTSLGRAVWLANQTTFEQLMTLTIDVGTGGVPISLVNINATPNMTMLGRPLILTEKVPALGSEGCLSFLDLSYYLIGDRQAVTMDTSEHARFLNDETLLRVIERVDGRPWIQSAFQPLNGDTISPFVTLGDN
jgi:HK97 family phage major capsid protein